MRAESGTGRSIASRCRGASRSRVPERLDGLGVALSLSLAVLW